jgi:hypothetical protein
MYISSTCDMSINQHPKCDQEKNIRTCRSTQCWQLSIMLRNKCSSLNSDLFKSNLVPSASCSCGYKNECSEHFLLYCNKLALHQLVEHSNVECKYDLGTSVYE